MKSDFFTAFLSFQNLVKRQLECKMQVFQRDRGGEFISIKLSSHLGSYEIKHQMSCPHTPQ